jgi:VanZ family protein
MASLCHSDQTYMFHILQRILSKRFPAISWTLIIFILLSLPGGMLPNENNLSIPNLDKFVHVTMFGGFVFLWCLYFSYRPTEKPVSKTLHFSIFLIACVYGTVMEYVQKYFIPNRDFDIYDILADIAGALVGYLFVILTISWTKKKNNR